MKIDSQKSNHLNWPIIGYGFSSNFFSALGQTFLLALFIPHIRSHFALDAASAGWLYSIATLVSALVMPYQGHLLDRVSIKKYTAVIALVFLSGVLLLAFAIQPAMVFFGFLFLRNAGQANLTMMASTTVARYVHQKRGKAMALIMLGFPLSEAIHPGLTQKLINQFGWQNALVLLASGIIFYAIISQILLYQNDRYQKQTKRNLTQKDDLKKNNFVRSLFEINSKKQVLKNPFFYLLILPAILPAGFFTGLIYHFESFNFYKSWTNEAFATAMIGYAIARASFGFVCGWLIDRIGSILVLFFSLIPMILGLHVLWLIEGKLALIFYLACLGATIGMTGTTKAALWPELFGVKILGFVKGTQNFITVFATALAPVLFGYYIDSHNSLHYLILILIFINILALVLCLFSYFFSLKIKEKNPKKD